MNALLWLGLLLLASGIAGLVHLFFNPPSKFNPEVKIMVDRCGNLIPKDTAEIWKDLKIGSSWNRSLSWERFLLFDNLYYFVICSLKIYTLPLEVSPEQIFKSGQIDSKMAGGWD